MDVIFEEYLGIDIHQETLLMNDIHSKRITIRGSKKASFFPPPEELYIIDDDESNSQAPAEDLDISNKSKREMDSMPSFNLIDEELENVAIAEVVANVETEQGGCKILTDETVFDHIRKKSTNFPVLTSRNTACSPSSESLLLKRKGSRENAEVVEETDTTEVPAHIAVNPFSDCRDIEIENWQNFNEGSTQDILRSKNTIDLLDERGLVPPLPEEIICKTLNEEKIFDHIRKKAKNFPLFDKAKTVEDLRKQPEFRKVPRLVSNSEPKAIEMAAFGNKEVSENSCGTYKKLDNPLKELGTDADSTSITVPCFGCSDAESRRKKQIASNGSKRQCCSLETAGEIREANSFLGFKSVFSFL